MKALVGRASQERQTAEDAFPAVEIRADDGTEPLIHLLGACASSDAAVAAWARGHLKHRLSAIPISRLPQTDELVRRELSPWRSRVPAPPFAAWVNERGAARRVRLGGPAVLPVFALLSMHPSGYVREDAVARLALHRGGELPYLLLRANDWVEPVRRRATAALMARLASEYAPAWVAALPLVLRLRDCGRAEHGPLVDAVLDLLRQPACLGAVRGGLESADRATRRASYRLLAESSEDATEAVRAGLAHGDPVVRLLAARDVARLEPDARAELLPSMLADRFAGVRLLAAGYAADAGAEPLLRDAALDPSPNTRTVAAAGLARLGVDVAAFYRTLLAQDDIVHAGAVAGLGETGSAEDAAVVARFLADPRPRMRAAAVDAAARLGGDAAGPVLTRMVADASPSVSRAALRHLERRRLWLDPRELEALFEARHPTHVRKNALRLMTRRGRWEGVPAILRAHCDADPAVAEFARRLLLRWLNLQWRGHIAATAAEHERFAAALDEAGHCLPDSGVVARLHAMG